MRESPRGSALPISTAVGQIQSSLDFRMVIQGTYPQKGPGQRLIVQITNISDDILVCMLSPHTQLWSSEFAET